MTTTEPMTLNGYVIRIGAKCEPVEITRGQDSWREINETIRSHHFDVIGLPGSIDLFVNDEGLIDGSEFNLGLTIVVHQLGGRTAIFGDGLFLGIDQSTGDSRSLDDLQMAQILTAITSEPTNEILDALARTLGPMTAYLEAFRS